LLRIANFDPDKEEKLRKKSIYDFLFLLQALLEKRDEEQENDG